MKRRTRVLVWLHLFGLCGLMAFLLFRWSGTTRSFALLGLCAVSAMIWAGLAAKLRWAFYLALAETVFLGLWFTCAFVQAIWLGLCGSYGDPPMLWLLALLLTSWMVPAVLALCAIQWWLLWTDRPPWIPIKDRQIVEAEDASPS